MRMISDLQADVQSSSSSFRRTPYTVHQAQKACTKNSKTELGMFRPIVTVRPERPKEMGNVGVPVEEAGGGTRYASDF